MNDQQKPDITPLTDIMVRLRDPEQGCPWDVEQNFETIAPYTIEEAYEVVDAIERRDMAALCDELGDLLLQTVFHARIAEEAGHFAFQDVVQAVCEKMIRRHPHVFGDRTASPGWETIKEQERAASGKDPDSSALAGVASALPSLLRAQKLQKRAARTGFDWPDTQGVIAKIEEEIEEVRQARTESERKEEIGDLLFAVVNLARHLDVDCEEALRAANQKFERRFRFMEQQAEAGFPALALEEKESLWAEAKADEKRERQPPQQPQ